MMTRDAFIRTDYDEFININRIERIKITEPSFVNDKWHIEGYTMSPIGSHFGGWKFNTKEEAEEFVKSLLTLKGE